jgi:hypothetical protein
LARLQPRIVVDGVLLGHVLPRHDPTDVNQPWYIERLPTTAEEAAADFAAFPHDRMFLGHYHRWMIATPEAVLPWQGESPFRFAPGRRALVVVAAVCDGWCALYDTSADLLTPLTVDGG